MTDDRQRSSSSDDLLREARQRVMDGDLYSDDHLETSQDDTHGSSSFEDGSPDPAPDGEAYDENQELSAVEIAEQLAEAREAAKPRAEEPDTAPDGQVEVSAGGVRAGMSSLPEWALDDEPSYPVAPPRSSEPAAAPAPSGPLAERIRALAAQQSMSDPADIPAGQLQVPPPTDTERDVWSTPSPEWQARPDPKSRSGMSTSWIKPVISLVVFAIFGFGFVAAQLDGSEPIDQLAIGDCFDAGDATEVYSVPVIDCDELHSSELYGTVEIDALGSTYPGEDALFDWVNAECEGQFPAYVGEPYEESRYWIEVFFPTEDGWEEQDRIGLCTVVLVDENLEIRPSLGSARGWGERAT